MRKTLTLVALIAAFLVYHIAAYAQQPIGRVVGTVVDGSQKTIESSTITLLKAKDSSVAKISVADKNGRFEFEKIAQGKYLVSVSAVGHEKGYSEMFEI